MFDCLIHNTDRLLPAVLLETPDVVHYFADTRMAVRHTCAVGFQPDSFIHRVWIMPLADAFDPRVTVEEIMLDFAETPEAQLASEFSRLLGRWPRARECYDSLIRLPWTRSTDGENSYRTNKGGVLILRNSRCGTDVFSPFKRLDPIPAIPFSWTKAACIRMLHNGQFEDLSEVHDPAGSVSDAPAVSAKLNGMILCRHMTEDRWRVWSFEKDGAGLVAVSTTKIPGEPPGARRFSISPAYITG